MTQQLRIGDFVRNRKSGEIGVLALWKPGRAKAVLETKDGISDWIPIKQLELIEND
jgi:hypothetical protein